MSSKKTYKEWYKEIQWLQNKIILPDGRSISKESFITSNGFDIDGFNKLLFNEHNKYLNGK